MQTAVALEAARQARLALLEGSILALLRAGEDEGFDGLSITAEADGGSVAIDLMYTRDGKPGAGQSL